MNAISGLVSRTAVGLEETVAPKPASLVPALPAPTALAVAPSPGILAKVKSKLTEKVFLEESALGLGAGAVGAYVWKDHRVLGFLAGTALGSNVPHLLTADTRMQAVSNLTLDAGSVGGALLWENHPILGFLAGGVVGGIAARYLTGYAPYGVAAKSLLAQAKDAIK